MSQVTRMLEAISEGNRHAADELLPIVYNDLRELARCRLAKEKPGNSLQATALVHEAYVRLVEKQDVDWNSAGHFFGAAAEAMRRIVIERARQRAAEKYGGQMNRIEFSSNLLGDQPDERLLQLNDVLDELEHYDARKAKVVKLRFFAGLTNEETAAAIGISTATAQRDWQFSRAWLRNELRKR